MCPLQVAAVEELAHVRNMPQAYEAALAEVVRRRSFGRVYVSKVEAVAESLARLRASEVRHRERFLRRHGANLPKVRCLGRPCGLAAPRQPPCR